jgi:site-specific recombinase XerD
MIPHLLKDFLPNRHPETAICYRKTLHHWLRFQGRFAKPMRPSLWDPWLRDYIEFLRVHRGVGSSVIEHAEASVRTFLRSQFGRGEADWPALKISDIWRFAQEDVCGVKPIYAKARLGRLRRFLSFVHLRGACSAELAAAVPRIAVFGHTPSTVILSETQCRALLASFSRDLPEGRRDYAMTLCMLELGLRGAEVIGLRLHDIDWRGRQLNVPATKTGRGRTLPIPERVFIALRDYVKSARPSTSTDHVFIRHPRLAGQPLSRSVLKGMIRRAYRRCGFPHSWSGTHRLRHTFASRLHRRGVDLKPIADLLGHRQFNSTSHYTHVDVEAMRPLAQPWPN